MMPPAEDIARARGWIDAARRIVVLSGAGISTDSGIADFRGPQGLWTRNPAAEMLSTIQHYLADPAVRRAAWQARLDHSVWQAQPNRGHLALVALERRGKLHIGREVTTSISKFLSTGATTGSVNFPQVELGATAGKHRIINVHNNVPGVMRDINKIVSDSNANISAQMLATDPEIGYLVMDLEQDVAQTVGNAIGALSTSIRSRVVA